MTTSVNAASCSERSSRFDRDRVSEILDECSKRYRDEKELVPQIPLHFLLGEAIDLAELVEQHFQTQQTEQGEVPGLIMVAARGEISENTPSDLRELQVAIAAVRSRLRVLVESRDDASLGRAPRVLSELKALLAYFLEDGKHPDGEAQLEFQRRQFSGSLSHDGLAMALEGYAELAAAYGEEMLAIGSPEKSLVSEALPLAQALRQRSAKRLVGSFTIEHSELMHLRNRLVGTLTRKMSGIRRAFRYVFHNHPEIVKKAGSQYLRNQRREHRKSKRQEVLI